MSELWNWILAIFFALLPAIFWLMIWYRKDFVQPEPKEMVIKAFLCGMLGVIPFFGIQFMLEHSPNLLSIWGVFAQKSFLLSTLLLTFCLATLEEGVKYFSVLGLGKKLDKYFDQIVDGIVYCVSAALGFAFMENVLYFGHALLFVGISAQFWEVFMFRSFGTMLGHAIFSGIFGFFWGYALFSFRHAAQGTAHMSRHTFWDTLRFRIIFERVLPDKPLKRSDGTERDLIREAFLFAVVLHLIFNLLLTFQVFGRALTPFIVPILIVGFLYLSHQFAVKRNTQIWTPERT